MRHAILVSLFLAATSTAGAQRRVSELGLGVVTGGEARRQVVGAETREPLAPGIGLDLRFIRRLPVAAHERLDLGGRLAGTLWRPSSLQRTEGGWRTSLDAGLFARWTRDGPWSPSASIGLGPSVLVPSIPELFAGVRFGVGMHVEVAGGLRHRAGRAEIAIELAWVHHRLAAPLPSSLTVTHRAVLRLVVGLRSAE